MTITATASTATAGNQSSGAQLQVVVTNDILPGDVIVVAIACDNANTSGTSSITTPTDSQGHVYTLVKNQNRTAGSAVNDGCTVAIYVARCTIKLASLGTTINANFSPNTTAKAISYQAFRGVEDIAYSTNSVSGTGATYNSAATATASLTAIGDICLVAVAVETGNTIVVDADTVNGSWASSFATSGGTGADTSKMGVLLQWKIVTGTGTQTASASAGATTDWAVAWGLFTVPVTKSDTETNVTSVDVDSSIQTLTAIGDDDPASGADADGSLATAVVGAELGGGIEFPGASFGAENRYAQVMAFGGNAPAGVNSGGNGGGVVNQNIGQVTYTGSIGQPVAAGAGDRDGGNGGGSAGSGGRGGVSFNNFAGLGGADYGSGASGASGGTGGAAGASTAATAGSIPGGGGGGGFSKAGSASNGAGGGRGQIVFTQLPSGTVTTITAQGTSTQTLTWGADDTVVIECWGNGGSGGDGVTNTNPGSGGGGGGYARSIIPKSQIDTSVNFGVQVPGGGDGGICYVSWKTADSGVTAALTQSEAAHGTLVCLAKGGAAAADPATGGQGGQASAGTGTTKFSGGSGSGGGVGTGNQNGGGGGGNAGSTGNGGNSVGLAGGSAGSGLNGGTGGTGGNAATTTAPTIAAGSPVPGSIGGRYSTATTASGFGGSRFSLVKLTFSPSGTAVQSTTGVTSGGGENGVVAIPSGDTSVLVQCWGGGAGPGSATTNTNSGGGGGGGAYSETTVDLTLYPATALLSYDVGLWTTGSNQAGRDASVWISAVPESELSLADALTDDEPATGVDAGESLADALSDFESMTSAEAESIFVAIMGNLVTTGSLIMHL